MKIIYKFLILIILTWQTTYSTSLSFASEKKSAASNSGIGFLENKGQMTDMHGEIVPFVLFKTSAPGLDVYVTERGLTYVFIDWIQKSKQSLSVEEDLAYSIYKNEETKPVSYTWERVDVKLKEASIKKENIIAEYATQGEKRYFLPHCPDGIMGVKSYKKITIKEIYPGIDWILEFDEENHLKYSFFVYPGADHKLIELQYIGAGDAELLIPEQIGISTPKHTLQEGKLYCYTGNDITDKVTANYQLKATTSNVLNDKNRNKVLATNYKTQEININIPDRDITRLLVIDPPLEWSTFIGGNDSEGFKDIECDTKGNVFGVGDIYSTEFPVQDAGAYYQGTKPSLSLFPSIFIMKFDNDGQLLWSTYYGGSGEDKATALAIDINNNIVIAGTTSSNNFPLKNIGTFFQPALVDRSDFFILKFDNNGDRIWATYMGGSDFDYATSVDTDSKENIFIAGYTKSDDFPLWDAGTFFNTKWSGNSTDIVYAKFSGTGEQLWTTYVGGSKKDQCNAITIDSNDHLIAVGITASPEFPLQDIGTFFIDTFQYPGWEDMFISEFDNNGNVIWSSLYGAPLHVISVPKTIIVDRDKAIYISGYITSQYEKFPLQDAGTFYTDSSVGNSAFILKYDEARNRTWGTLFGGNVNDATDVSNLVVDQCNNVYISLFTFSDKLPVTTRYSDNYYDDEYYSSFPDSIENYVNDIFLAQFDDKGNLLWGSYWGGNGDEYTGLLTITPDDELFLAWTFAPFIGTTFQAPDESTYPLLDNNIGYFDNTYYATGSYTSDIGMAKFSARPAIAYTSDSIFCPNDDPILQAPEADSYLWNTQAMTQIISIPPTDEAYSVLLTNECNGLVDTAFFNIDIKPFNPSIKGDTSICFGEETTLTASTGTEFFWNTSERTPSIIVSPTQSQSYTVYVSDTTNGFLCDTFIKANVIVGGDECNPLRLFMPNAFLADKLSTYNAPIVPATFTTYHLSVYNRFGELMFFSQNPNDPWDWYKGTSTEVFTYQLQVDDAELVGNFTIIK